MTYAITLCFDKTSESVLDQARWSAQKKLGLCSSKADAYASHITLGIFENLASAKLTKDMKNIIDTSELSSISFAGFGMFKTATGFLLFLPIAPSLELLLLHNAVQKNLNYATRPTHFYDVGKWIPHWTFAAGLPADTSVSLAHRLIPQELFLQQVRPDRVELTYAKNIIEDPVEIIWSTSVSSATNDAARDS